MNLEAAKRELRRQAGARRRALSAAAADAVAARVCEHLLAERAIVDARRVALYAALPDEVPTRPLFEALVARGHDLPAPAGRARRDASSSPWSSAGRSFTPGATACSSLPRRRRSFDPADGDVVVVPGVAFDRAGRRLGRGEGYYDRTFPASDRPQPLLFGVACEAQIVESVPADSHDRAMDAIVTERAFRWTKGGR